MTYPQSELSRLQRTATFLYDLGRHGARQLRYDRAAQMAGALAFRTLFALLPTLVLCTVLVRAFRGFDDFRTWLASIFTKLGLDNFRVVAEGPTLSQWLLGLIGEVEKINVAAIGWVGLAVVIYSAISLMVTIEKAFNLVYRAPEGRTWARRLTVYWTVLTLGPAAIIAAAYIGKVLESFFSHQVGWLSIFRAAPVIWSYLALWLVTFALYKLIPNTNVTYRPALFGALLAAILLELGRRTLGVYFAKAVSFSQLYGSLGLIPVFMFWVYLMWLVILFGLEVSATLQMLGGRRLEDIESSKERTGLVDPASVLLVMQVVAEQFRDSRATTARHIADVTAMPESTVVGMIERLIEAGFLHRLDRDDGAVSLAVPPDQISADQLIEVGYRMADEGATDRSSTVLHDLREAQRKLASKVTLAAIAAQASV